MPASFICGSLFAEDADRGARLTVEAQGIYLDYSKNRVTGETLHSCCQLAEESGLRARIDAMFRGEKINVTEPCGAARGSAGSARRLHRGRTEKRRARSPRRAR